MIDLLVCATSPASTAFTNSFLLVLLLLLSPVLDSYFLRLSISDGHSIRSDFVNCAKTASWISFLTFNGSVRSSLITEFDTKWVRIAEFFLTIERSNMCGNEIKCWQVIRVYQGIWSLINTGIILFIVTFAVLLSKKLPFPFALHFENAK